MATFRFLPFFSVLLAVTLVSVGCGIQELNPNEGKPLTERSELVIGVSAGQPQVGMEAREGVYEGLDVDVAVYLAKELGFHRSQFRFVPARPDRRVGKLLREEVDMVVASYPITPAQKTRVQFAGPYFVARQDIVVRQETTDISNVRDLDRRSMCAARGTDAFDTIRALDVLPLRRTASTWSGCLLQLKVGEVDAVSASDATIAGYLRWRHQDLRLVGAPFAEERWGVGLRKQDVRACEQLNRAIARMYAEGAALRMQQKWFSGTGLRLSRDVPQFEGCG